MEVSYDVVEARTFWDCVMSQRRDDSYRAELMETLIELRRQPFKNPVLQTHEVGTARNGKKIFSSDVGGRRSDRRLVWQLFNRTLVVLLYGTHAVHDRAKRMRVDFEPDERVVTVYDLTPDTRQERTYQENRAAVGKLFMAWTDAELAGFGFNPALNSRAAAPRRTSARHGRRPAGSDVPAPRGPARSVIALHDVPGALSRWRPVRCTSAPSA